MARLLASLFLLVLVLHPRVAEASRFPASTGIVFDPHESKTVYVRTTFGLLVTRDGGDAWRWICEKAIGVSPDEDPAVAVTPSGALVVATATGVAVSRDGGCSFDWPGGRGTNVLAALAMRESGEIVGVQSKAGMGTMHDNHLVIGKDDAKTFDVGGGPIDPALGVSSVAIAPSDPTRLYLAGEGTALLASFDGGTTWVARKMELVRGETGTRIGGVNPKNADQVYVVTFGAPGTEARILATDDAGKTWKKAFEAAGPLPAFAVGEGGARLFAGGRDGVVASPSASLAFTQGSTKEIQCLAASGSALWACSTEKSGFFVGISRSGGRGFDAKLHTDEIKGPLECPAESAVAKECPGEWSRLRRELGLPEADEKPKSRDPGAPALRGRATRTGRSSKFGIAGVAILVSLAFIGYEVLKRVRKRP